MEATGYDQLPTVRDRINRFLRESMELGKPWSQAAAVAAVSINETAGVFLATRLPGSGAASLQCFPNRQVLALEVGNPNLGQANLPASWTGDAQIMDNMRGFGFLQPNSTRVTAEFARLDLNPQNNNMCVMFEFLIDQRKLQALEVFSIGATQMFLRFSPLTGGAMASRFTTIEQLWKFWYARTIADLWDTGAWSYLFAAPNISEALTQCGNANGAGCVEHWLQNRQTGAVDWAGNFKEYARRFKETNIPLVYAEGRKIGYPNIV